VDVSFVVRGRTRRTLVAAAVAVVVVLGVAGWAVFLRPSDSAAAAVTYRSATVTTGTLRQSVSASGTVQATDTQDLTFPAAGQVTAVWVTAGQKVSKGQRLAAIDSATLSSEVAAAKATLATAQAKLAADQAAGASSTQLAADSASITVAQGQVSSATADLAGATITAPFAGTVTSVGYAVGQQVGGSGSSGAGSGSTSGAGPASGAGTGTGSGSSSGSSSGSGSGSGSSSIHLVSTGSYEVQASVDASEVGQIKAGNQAIITVGNATQNVFGTVSSVGIVATTTSGVASFPVVVGVTGSPSGVYPGATASLQIVYKQLSAVLLVPTLAINRTSGTTTVLVPNGGKQVRRTITTGLSSGGQTQVLSGLTEGEQVLVPVPTGTGTGGTNGRTGRQFPGGGQVPGGTFPRRTGGGFGGGNGGGFGGFGGGGGAGGTGGSGAGGSGTGQGNGP
jgi:multidrug efflux pump subunit AcrA (membrane-fusion protein)